MFTIAVLWIRYRRREKDTKKDAFDASQWSRGDRDDFEARILVFGLVALGAAGLVWISAVPLLPLAWVGLELAAIGIMVTAGFFGFLFGLPHTNAGLGSSAGTPQPLLQTSTNLEQIADKLTQLLTGVALAELLTVPMYLKAFDDYVSCSGGAPPLVGMAMMLYFAPLGFVLAYVFTRTVGSSVFAKYDTALWASGRALVAQFPPLPDVEGSPNDDQKNTARKIVQTPLGDLTDDGQRIVWGRAQAMLDNYGDAGRAFALVYPRNNNDPRFLYDYATTLYNDTTFDDPPFVLFMAEKADKLAAAASSPDRSLQGRIRTLMIATYLYGADGGYVEAINAVNEFLRGPFVPTKVLRFYRACAFGQLFRAEDDPQGAVSANDLAAISLTVNHDVAITLAFGNQYRDQLLMVSDPNKHIECPGENDLQTLASVDPALCAQLGLQPPPPRAPAQVGAQVRLPLPPAIAPDTAIQTLAKQCPP